MKITCLHGYYIFEPKYSAEINEFNSWFSDAPIAMSDKGHYTFKDLVDAPTHSIKGSTFMGELLATETFEGTPWDVMRANKFVYDFSLGVIRPISLIGRVAEPMILQDRFKDGGLYIAGSTIKGINKKMTGFTCFMDFQMFNFNYSEFYYD